MVKPYLNKNHVTPLGLLMLVVGSICAGILVGGLAFLVSNFFYLTIVFPIGVGVIGILAFYYVVQYAKVRLLPVEIVFGLLTGLIVAITFYAIPFLVERHNFIADAQANYSVDVSTASDALDDILREETGYTGLPGYMAYRAKEGETRTTYFMSGGVVTHTRSYTIQSTGAWIYWLIEALLMAIPVPIMNIFLRKPFNQSANNWYESLPHQVGSVALENKNRLLGMFGSGHLQDAAEIISAEDFEHPQIEIYEQHSKNRQGNYLVTLKQTRRVDTANVKRTILSQWEIPAQEFTALFHE